MSYDTEVMADSPTVYLKLNETTGTVAADSSGNGYDFTYGTGVTLGVSGIVASDSSTAVSQTSGGTVASIASVPAPLVNPAAFTLEVMVDLPNTSMAHALMYIGGGNGYGYGLGVSSGSDSTWNNPGNTLVAIAGNVAWVPSGASIGSAGRHLLALAKDSSGWYFHSDGVLIATHAPVTPGAGGGSSSIGGLTGGTATWQKAAVYTTRLSTARLLAHYNATLAAPATAPVVTGDPLNASALLRWSAVPTATSYDVSDGTTTNNTTATSYVWTGLTNGVGKTFTVTAKNSTGSGPASSNVSVTPTATPAILLWDSFSRTATPPGAPDYGPSPTVQTTVTADGSKCRSTTTTESYMIWDVTSTDLIKIDLTVGQIDGSASTGISLITGYTDSSNFDMYDFNIGAANQGTVYKKIAGTYNNYYAVNLRVPGSDGSLRNIAAGDVITAIVTGDTVRLYYNGIPRSSWTYPRAASSKVGFRITGGVNWAIDSIQVSITGDSTSGYVYKGRPSKTYDSGSAA